MSYLLNCQPAKTLDEVSGSSGYLREIGGAVERIALCQDEEQLVDVLRDTTALLGASSSYFVTFLREDRSFDSYSLLLACDPLWGLEYEHGECYAHDPWLAYARSHSAPARGSEIPRNTEREGAVALLAAAFWFRSVVVAPAPTAGSTDRLGMLVLGSEEDGFFEAKGYGLLGLVVRAVSMGLHERRAALARQEFLAGGKLRPAELDLLRYELQGHCSKSIARMMGTSPGAIDARFDPFDIAGPIATSPKTAAPSLKEGRPTPGSASGRRLLCSLRNTVDRRNLGHGLGHEAPQTQTGYSRPAVTR